MSKKKQAEEITPKPNDDAPPAAETAAEEITEADADAVTEAMVTPDVMSDDRSCDAPANLSGPIDANLPAVITGLDSSDFPPAPSVADFDEMKRRFIVTQKLSACFFAAGIGEEIYSAHESSDEWESIAVTAAAFVRDHSDAPAEAVIMQVKLKHKIDLLPAIDPRLVRLAVSLFKTALQSIAAIEADDAKAAETRRQTDAWAAATAKPIREEERGIGAELENPFAPSTLAKSFT